MKHYIIMCDMMNSRHADQALIMQQFKACTQYINTTYKKSILSPLTITLGDEFQGVVQSLEACIRILIDLEEYIIANDYHFKLRYVVNYGAIDTPINKSRAYEMLGTGLTDARMYINELKKSSNRFLFHTEDEVMDTLINNSFIIFQEIVDQWNIEKDHAIIHEFILHKDYKIVAENLQKDRSLMWKREKSLHLKTYYSIKAILSQLSLRR